ncbi:MAG: RagB/SusD family nutrient uptake outer membrane protein [Flavobacterium sp.]
MKKIIIMLGMIVTALSSCSNYIEEESLSNVPADATYKTASGFQLLINSNYAWNKSIYGGNPWMFESGTDMYAEGRTPEPAGLSQYSLLIPTSDNVADLYGPCYQLIQSVNKAIYYSAITEQTSNLNTLIGEARFLRANAYFLLVQSYGGVAIVNEHITTPVLSFHRNTAEEVYTQIIGDLDFALANVGTTTYSTTGKVNKRAVNDLLAKVYLTRGYETFGKTDDFSKAAAYADAAIAGQALNIASDQLFKPGNDLNAETIFSVQYDKASTSTDPTKLGNNQFYYFEYKFHNIFP